MLALLMRSSIWIAVSIRLMAASGPCSIHCSIIALPACAVGARAVSSLTSGSPAISAPESKRVVDRDLVCVVIGASMKGLLSRLEHQRPAIGVPFDLDHQVRALHGFVFERDAVLRKTSSLSCVDAPARLSAPAAFDHRPRGFAHRQILAQRFQRVLQSSGYACLSQKSVRMAVVGIMGAAPSSGCARGCARRVAGPPRFVFPAPSIGHSD